MSYQRIRVAQEGAIARIALARPAKKNALDRLTADELTAALRELGGNDAVRVIAIEGDGDDFCAGADLEALEQMIDASADVHLDDARALGRVFTTIREVPKVVVALVRGRALAGGAGLANACDLVFARDDAQFGYPEVRIGFVPAMVMTMLRRSVGEKQAADLVLTGRTITAEDAKKIGLISRVIPAASFDAKVAEALEYLAKSPPAAAAATKRLLYSLDGLGFAEGVEAGAQANARARATDDFKNGVRKFVAKRKDS